MTGIKRGLVLQERDHRLLQELAVMRVADREQIKLAAGFHSTTRVNARLLALMQDGFLRRFFLGTVGGARKALYSVSAKAATIIGVPERGPRRSQDQTLAADFFTNHQLEINKIYSILKHTEIPVAGTSFERWLSFQKPLEPNLALIPDGYAEIATPAKPLAMFIEVDLGNESRAVWQRKVRGYLQFAESGEFAGKFGQPTFRVLVAANSERRMASLCKATAAITHKLFWFATLDSIRRPGFWSPIWRRAGTAERICLL